MEQEADTTFYKFYRIEVAHYQHPVFRFQACGTCEGQQTIHGLGQTEEGAL